MRISIFISIANLVPLLWTEVKLCFLKILIISPFAPPALSLHLYSPPPQSDLFMENLHILCGLQVWLAQIYLPSHEGLCGDNHCIPEG